MFSFQSGTSEFRIVRRAKRWFVECSGETLGSFSSAADAARALAECELLWPEATDVPAEIDRWRRGAPRADLAAAS